MRTTSQVGIQHKLFCEHYCFNFFILDNSDSTDEDDNPNASLQRFLTAWGLKEYVALFEEQEIDLDALMLLTESDLKSLNLPLGPYRKLVTAINERKSALEKPGN